jgi:acetyl esterase
MPLDPQARLVLDSLPPGLLDVRTQAPAELRALYQGQTTIFPGEPVANVETRRVPGPAGEIPVRIYTPAGGGAHPAIAFFHGGGWVIGNLETHDGTARKLANASGCTVMSVDYRLAPEHRFPAAAEDCYAALRWLAANAAALGVRADALAVAGDSAGGNLAAVTAQMARDRRGPELAFQLLVYPVVAPDFETQSYRENADGYLLTRDVMRWFWDQYVPDAAERTSPYASPLAARELAGLPPALVITAEYDPLRDEGEAYARALRESGVPVTASRYDGVIHGFFSFADFMEQGKRAVEQAGAALRAALRP